MWLAWFFGLSFRCSILYSQGRVPDQAELSPLISAIISVERSDDRCKNGTQYGSAWHHGYYGHHGHRYGARLQASRWSCLGYGKHVLLCVKEDLIRKHVLFGIDYMISINKTIKNRKSKGVENYIWY